MVGAHRKLKEFISRSPYVHCGGAVCIVFLVQLRCPSSLTYMCLYNLGSCFCLLWFSTCVLYKICLNYRVCFYFTNRTTSHTHCMHMCIYVCMGLLEFCSESCLEVVCVCFSFFYVYSVCVSHTHYHVVIFTFTIHV